MHPWEAFMCYVGRCTFALVAASFMLKVSAANADPITYTFSGTVTFVDPLLSSTFDVSQTMSGAFTYDSSAPVQFISGSDASGFANYLPAVVDFSMTVGVYSASLVSSGGIVQVGNNIGIDRFLVGAPTTGPPVNGLANPIGHLTLLDASQAAFTDIQLTDVGPLMLSAFTQTTWNMSFGPAGSAPFVQGDLTSLTLQATSVPEPATATLLLGGVVVAVRRRLRQQPWTNANGGLRADGGPRR
jgi:hypothetical protein